ncbi:MAG TPA: hypothetical protein VEP71_02765 [Gallionella sp.]|nr:hypothetical protein [Gallionella sp.]
MKNWPRRIHWILAAAPGIVLILIVRRLASTAIFFKLYALDTVLQDLKFPAKAEIEKAL